MPREKRLKHIPIEIITLEHDRALNHVHTRKVVFAANDMLETIGVSLNITKYTRLPGSDVSFIADTFKYPEFMFKVFQSESKPGELKHFFLRPIQIEGYNFHSGYSIPGIDVTVSTSFFQDYTTSKTKPDAFVSVAAIMAQHVAHALGAEFLSGRANLMHPYLHMFSSHHGLSFAQETKRQVERYLWG